MNSPRCFRAVVSFLGCVSAALLAPRVAAQDPPVNYPVKSLRMVVPFATGGPTDILARSVGMRLSEVWGQPVVVDNRAGAAGNIGAEMVARAAPDGYTLLTASSGILTVNPSLFRKLPFDVLRDFAPITLATSVTNILVVHPALPAKSVRELLDIARRRPGQLSYASSGMGSASHLSMELLKSMANIDVAHIPYKGAHPGVVDLAAGQVQIMLIGLPAALPHVKTGRLRALAVANKSVALPNMPTIAESGLPGFTVVNWLGVLAPAGVPRDRIARLNTEINKAVHLPEMKARLLVEGFEPLGSTPEKLHEEMRAWIPRWSEIIRKAGIRAE
mgnify:CR=1 FL=1